MRRARLIPPWIRERTWERGFHLEQSIHGNELGRVVQSWVKLTQGQCEI